MKIHVIIKANSIRLGISWTLLCRTLNAVELIVSLQVDLKKTGHNLIPFFKEDNK